MSAGGSRQVEGQSGQPADWTVQWLKAINACLLTTGDAAEEKIRQLICLGVELLEASNSFYNRLAGGGRPCDSQSCSGSGSCEAGQLCQEVLRSGGDKPVLIPDLTSPRYAQLLPKTFPAGMHSYLGRVVICDGQIMGCLCFLFREKKVLSADDSAIIDTLAAAIGVEEERRRAQDALRLSELKYQSLFDRIRDIFFRADINGRILLVSPAVERVLGYSPQEALGLELTVLSKSPLDQQQVSALLQDGKPIERHEAALKAKDGGIVWVQTNLYPVRDAGGTIIGLEGIARDITERKRAEAERLETENKFRAIFDSAQDSIFIKTTGGRYTFANPCMERLLGLPAEQIVGKTDADLFGAQDAADIPEVDRRVLAGEIVVSVNKRLIHGELGTFHVVKAPLRRDDGSIYGLCGIARDITRAEQSREDLRRSEERYRRLVENAPLGVLTIDTSGQIVEVNSTMVSMLGSPSAEATRRINLLSFPLLVDSGIASDFRRCLESGELIVAEHPYRSTWGKDALFRYHLRPIHQSAETISGVLGIVEDITASRRAEQERQALEEQLHQAQKMEAIGQLAGGVAHDMNNLLGAILGLASLLHFEMDPEDAWRNDLEGIISACRKGRDLTRNLLGFARRGKYLKEPISLNQVTEEVQELLRRTIPKKIALQVALQPDLPAVEGDPSQINQALMNICLNAVDAVAEQGSIVVRTRLEQLSGDRLAAHPDVSPGEYCCLEVTDSGCGMTADQLRQVFEPFFTTKPRGKGTGLGLSMVYGTVRSHGGLVTIDSTPEQGTTVSVFLPALEPYQERERTPGPKRLPGASASGLVLVVDDEPWIREACSRMLAALGYSVLLAEHGRQAVELYQQHAGAIALVILDLVMPVMDGEETFRLLRELQPEVKVLLASGYSQEHKADQLIARGAAGFLQKPFELEALVQAINQALGMVEHA